MEANQNKAKKFGPGKYGYAQWIIEYFPEEQIWLMFPPGQNGATDAAQTLKGAKAMIDQWEFTGWFPASATYVKIGQDQIFKV